MPFLKHVPPVHECWLPSPKDSGPGTVWQCDSCQEIFILTVDAAGFSFSDSRWYKAYLWEDGDYHTFREALTEGQQITKNRREKAALIEESNKDWEDSDFKGLK